ncbi:MAG: glycine cleavage system protein GcvH [Candidatus Thermoplasmatota archaeon]|nr:glycine cleavage system protein GcvH [Candidatus Thermoplasmatota archaeon]MDD5778315.1 glycine cleavage system protein GcvH [Candidatus Thermoplasmatota archaeon]
MTEIRDNLLYTESDEWVHKKDGVVRIGITDYAQEHLTDVVYVELPSVGDTFSRGDEMATIESVKSVSEIYAPVSGEVIEVNTRLDEEPELVNGSPYDEGWLVELKMSDESETAALLSPSDYRAKLG